METHGTKIEPFTRPRSSALRLLSVQGAAVPERSSHPVLLGN